MTIRKIMSQLASGDKHPFHMPGHKGKFKDLYPGFDPTELPGLDNLHNPQDSIALAQCQIADIYNTYRTYFLVNGSSVGIFSAMSTLVAAGEKVLVQRSCHKAIISGLIHSGAMPVWVEQELCSLRKHWLPPCVKSIQGLLAQNTVKAAVFSNPDYFGLVSDIVKLQEVLKEAGVKTLVDEAHGAHLRFGKSLLPKSAVDVGYDIIVQSAHKTLPALTQSAWLHLNNSQLAGKLQQALNLFQTTSPSYILLASLEFAGEFLKDNVEKYMKKLSALTRVLEHSCVRAGLDFWPRHGRDWTKFIVENRPGMLDLLHRRGVYPEIVRNDVMLFMLTMADAVDPSGVAQLSRCILESANLPKVKDKAFPFPPPVASQEITPREAWFQPGTTLTLDRALGRIARQVIAPYPPGTMIVAPGQRLCQEHIEYLKLLHAEKVVPGWIEVI